MLPTRRSDTKCWEHFRNMVYEMDMVFGYPNIPHPVTILTFETFGERDHFECEIIAGVTKDFMLDGFLEIHNFHRMEFMGFKFKFDVKEKRHVDSRNW